MSVEGAITKLLLADSGITAIVGQRVRPLYAAQTDKRPLLTVSVTNKQRGVSHSGGIGSGNATVEIGIITDSYADAVNLSETAQRVLHGFSGNVGDTGLALVPVVYDDETDVEQAVGPGQSKPAYLKTVSFRARYRPAAN